MDIKLKGLTEDTPLELYHIKGREVWVKRDDLMGDGMVLPPWGKLAALFELVKKFVDKSKPLVHLSVDGSWTAWALGAICEELGIEFYAAHPDSKKISQEYLGMIKEMYPKTNLYPIRPNMMQIMYNSLKKDAREKGWQMLPYAFDHDFYKDYLADRIQPFAHFDNLVVSSGSGVTLSGLAKGYYREELKEFFPQVNRKIWTTCVSSVSSINKTLKKSGIHIPLNIRKSEYLFDDRMESHTFPLELNQFWERKQWHWLENNIDEIEGTILFWNIGGIYKF